MAKDFNSPNISMSDFREALTPKEVEVLCLRCKGLGLVEIGKSLRISKNTARNYMTRIYDKTQIRVIMLLCETFRYAEKKDQKRSVINADDGSYRNLTIKNEQKETRGVEDILDHIQETEVSDQISIH